MKRFLGKILIVIFSLILWSLSFAQNTDQLGVLIIAHGSPNRQWNRYIEWAIEDLKIPFPVKLSFLEFTHPTIQEAIKSLESMEINYVIAMPLFISSESGHIEEIKYILNLRPDNPSKEPIEPIDTYLTFKLTKAIQQHPYAIKTIANKIRDLEKFLKRADLSLQNTNLVLIGHGDKEFSNSWNLLFNEIEQKVVNYLSQKYNISFSEHRHIFLQSLKKIKDYYSKNYCKIKDTFVCIPVFVAPGFLTDKLIPGYLDKIKNSCHEIKIFYIKKSLLPSKYITKLIATRVAETITPLIKFYENGYIKKINIILKSIKNNEDICLCRLFGYKAFQMAIYSLGDEQYIPKKENLKILTRHPCPEVKKLFEEIAIFVQQTYHDTYHINYKNFYFEIEDLKLRKKVIIQVKPKIFPDNFFELRLKIKKGQATLSEIKKYQQLKDNLIYKLLWSINKEDLKKIFDIFY